MGIITLGIAHLAGTHPMAMDWVTVGGIMEVVTDMGDITPAEDGGPITGMVVIILVREANIPCWQIMQTELVRFYANLVWP